MTSGAGLSETLVLPGKSSASHLMRRLVGLRIHRLVKEELYVNFEIHYVPITTCALPKLMLMAIQRNTLCVLRALCETSALYSIRLPGLPSVCSGSYGRATEKNAEDLQRVRRTQRKGRKDDMLQWIDLELADRFECLGSSTNTILSLFLLDLTFDLDLVDLIIGAVAFVVFG
jgi:hypothetical protein